MMPMDEKDRRSPLQFVASPQQNSSLWAGGQMLLGNDEAVSAGVRPSWLRTTWLLHVERPRYRCEPGVLRESALALNFDLTEN